MTQKIGRELLAIGKMTVSELREKYAALFGEESASRNRDYLRKRVGYRIQELAMGGLTARAKGRIAELSAECVPHRPRKLPPFGALPTAAARAERARDRRMPAPGAILRKDYKGRSFEVTVLDDGFRFRGKAYESLSAIAREITGTQWNGWTFFGLNAAAAS